MKYEEFKKQLLDDFFTSKWMRETITLLDQRDIINVMEDLSQLKVLFSQKLEESLMIKYKIVKSDKSRAHSSDYQILENFDCEFKDGWRCCGEYLKLKDAKESLNKIIKNDIRKRKAK